jgi:hypothetical protein
MLRLRLVYLVISIGSITFKTIERDMLIVYNQLFNLLDLKQCLFDKKKKFIDLKYSLILEAIEILERTGLIIFYSFNSAINSTIAIIFLSNVSKCS